MKRIIAAVSAVSVAVLTLTAIVFMPGIATAATSDTYTAYVTYASAPKEVLGKTSWGMKKLTAEEAAGVPPASITVRASQFMRSSTDNSLYKVVYETVTPITELTWEYEGYPTPRVVNRPPAMEYYTYASYPSEMVVRTPLGVWRKAKVSEYTSVPDEKIVHRVGTYFIRNVGSAQIYKKSGGVTTAISDAQWRGEGSPTPMVPATAVVGTNLFAASSPYRDPTYPSVAAAKRARIEGRTADAAQIDKISAHAGSLWIGEWYSGASTTKTVADYAQRAIDTGQTGVLVVYAIPGRACTGYSSGGHAFEAYKPWIDEIAAGIAGRRLAVIIEPDALLQLDRCKELEGDRLGYLRYAAKTLNDAGGTVYIDAGASNFGEPASVMAARLTQAGVAGVRGFSVNVANHKWVGESRVYADEVSRLLGGKKYVIDTSRNGRGANGGDWCNSRGRALGTPPASVSYKNQDANLWIKTIGASDGTCGGGPTAGLWWDEIAVELAANSAITGTSVKPSAMISEWNVGAAGCATITVPVHGTVNATVDWGDGVTEQIGAGFPSHTYAVASGHRTITVEGTFTDWGGAAGWTPECITQVTRWGQTGTVSAAHGFAGATKLTDIAQFSPTITDMSYMLHNNTTFAEDVDKWDLSKVTNFSHMFDGATGFNRPVSMWNVSSATNLSGMFAGATSFNQPIAAWNTAKVTDFSAMFKDASSFHQPVGAWNTGSATKLASMFDGATSFNQPIGTWNTALVTDMSAMFRGAKAFTQTLSGWNTSRVTTFASMFDGATVFNQPLATWDTAKVTDMSAMFRGAESQNQGIGAWNTGNVRTMREMFRGSTAFNRALSTWNTAKVTDMTSMFDGATSFDQWIAGWDVAAVNASDSFRAGSALSVWNAPAFTVATIMVTGWDVGAAGCTAITVPVHGATNATIDWGDGTVEPVSSAYPSHTYASAGYRTVTVDGTFSGWGGSSPWSSKCLTKVIKWDETGTTSAAHGFAGATNLVDIAELPSTLTDMSWMFKSNTTFAGDVSGWDVSKVTNFSHMFDGATGFNRPVSMWNVSSATNLSGMFAGATSFNQPMGLWNTAKVTNFASMFKDAKSFHQPVGTWNTSSATSFASMFSGATTFNQPVKTWNTSNVTDLSYMFDGAKAFTQTLSAWDTSQVTSMASMLKGAALFNQPIGNWNTGKVANMSRMFYGAKAQNQGLSAWNTSNVTTMKEMFRDSTAFNRSLSAWNVAKVKDMTQMFDSAAAFNQPISGWAVSNVTAFSNFRTGSALQSYNAPAFG